MNTATALPSTLLPATVEHLLTDLVAAARSCFGDDLRSIVLFGSGAEGRLRPTSDLNLLFVLKRFEKSQADAFREPLRLAQVAGRATGMFLLESELAAAAEAFAVKFDDIGRRRRLLHGDDVLAGLTTSRAAKKNRLQQILMNLALRLRERYLVASLREEQLAIVVAETAGPLRSAAATLLELEGRPATLPREALEQMARSLHNPELLAAIELIPQARQARSLPAGVAGPALFQLMALTEAMRARTDKLT